MLFRSLALIPPVTWLLLILILGRCGVRWYGTVAPYPFLNYAAPAGWFGFQPETAGASSLGIGVFYAICALIAVYLAVARLLLTLACRRHTAHTVGSIKDYRICSVSPVLICRAATNQHSIRNEE